MRTRRAWCLAGLVPALTLAGLLQACSGEDLEPDRGEGVGGNTGTSLVDAAAVESDAEEKGASTGYEGRCTPRYCFIAERRLHCIPAYCALVAPTKPSPVGEAQ